jgi:threonine synthase
VSVGFVKRAESVVLILTGHLLKDPEFTLKFHRGELFAGTQAERPAGDISKYQRAPIVLEATVDAVLNTLTSAERV